MELYQLNYFKTVADLKSLTKASVELHISQPALSKSISSLEAELGTSLFDRKNRKMILNDHGQVFYRRAVKAIKDLEFAKLEVAQKAGIIPNSLTLCTLVPEYFTPITRAYVARNPGIRIRIPEVTHITYEEALIYGDISFAISARPFSHPSTLWFPLMTEEMIIIAPSDSPFAGYDSLPLSSFKDAPFICTLPGTSMHQTLTTFCTSALFAPNITIETPENDTIPILVSSGCGYALISDWLYRSMSEPRMDPDRPPYHAVRIIEPVCDRTIGIAIRRDNLFTHQEVDFLFFLYEFFRGSGNASDIEGLESFRDYINAHMLA